MAVDIIELPPSPPKRTPEQPAPKTTAEPSRAKLYVATPCFGCQLSLAYLTSVLNLQAACAARNIDIKLDFIGNESLVERARNLLVARFLRSDSTHLLFIDADIGFDPQAVFRLLDFDKDITTAVYPKKAINWGNVRDKLKRGDQEPVHQMGLDFNINLVGQTQRLTDGFLQVLDSATGFMLIKRGVLERMAEAYREELQCVNDVPGQDIQEYVALFACMIDPDTRRFLSEDYSFCRRYQKLGGEVWADVVAPLAHIGTAIYHGDIRQRFKYHDDNNSNASAGRP
jgi:hypothetical protein